MDFLDKVSKKISQTSQDVAQKTKNMAETMRLNNMISAEEKNINNIFHQIGKIYFETYEENPDQLFVQLIEGINDSKAKITSYSEQISQIKGSGTSANTAPEGVPVGNEASCSGCDSGTMSETVFCSYCGSKIEQSAPEQTTAPEAVREKESSSASDIVQCPSCGQEWPVGAAFCAGCGQKIGN